jgi:Tfp pilus assembly protein PilZ
VSADSDVSCPMMDPLQMPLQDPTITHQLFQLITEMSEDEKRTLLRFLKRGVLRGKCRRQHFRKPVHMPVRYTDKDGLSKGVVRDISLGGVFIFSQKAFSTGERLSISFFAADSDQAVWVDGDVMRVAPEGIGVRFRSMNEFQKIGIISFASKRSAIRER